MQAGHQGKSSGSAGIERSLALLPPHQSKSRSSEENPAALSRRRTNNDNLRMGSVEKLLGRDGEVPTAEWQPAATAGNGRPLLYEDG